VREPEFGGAFERPRQRGDDSGGADFSQGEIALVDDVDGDRRLSMVRLSGPTKVGADAEDAPGAVGGCGIVNDGAGEIGEGASGGGLWMAVEEPVSLKKMLPEVSTTKELMVPVEN